MPKNSFIEKYAKEIGKDEDVVNDAIICFFNYFKVCIKSKSLPDIRLKGFGVFKPALSRLKQCLKLLDNKRRYMSLESYNRRKNLIINYLNDHEFKKSPD